VACGFDQVRSLFDAEEVRGSNPLAPTKAAGQRPFSLAADLFLGGEERLSCARIRANPQARRYFGSDRPRAGSRSGGEEVDEKLTRASTDEPDGQQQQCNRIDPTSIVALSLLLTEVTPSFHPWADPTDRADSRRSQRMRGCPTHASASPTQRERRSDQPQVGGVFEGRADSA
jgi:hypothetical protein